MKIKVIMPTASQLIHKKGFDANGQVQKFHAMNVSRRIGKFMPHRTGTLETKLKRVSGTEIIVLGPYAKYQFYGMAMAGKAPRVVTGKPLEYTKDFNPQAGPHWDRALVAAEGKALTSELQAYIDRGR